MALRLRRLIGTEENLLDRQVRELLGAAAHVLRRGGIRQDHRLGVAFGIANLDLFIVSDAEGAAVITNLLDVAGQAFLLPIRGELFAQLRDVLRVLVGQLAAIGRAADEVDIEAGAAPDQEYRDSEYRQDDREGEPVIADG